MGQLDRFKLDDRVALVGGGGGAIGSAMAVALAEAGAKVAVTDISQEAVDATAVRVADVGGECLALAGDMTDRTAADDVVNKVVEHYGKLDIMVNAIGGGAGKVLLLETRRITTLPLANAEWLLIVDMEFKPKGRTVTLGKTPFGMIGVRMAKTIGVHDGGGTIRNSEGAVNEKEVFWKRAKWVDYCGAISNEKVEGITLFDHPDNPNFPSHFHVRNDGWMGASLTFDGPREIHPGQTLRLRYGLYVHSDMKPAEAIQTTWERFTKIRPADKY